MNQPSSVNATVLALAAVVLGRGLPAEAGPESGARDERAFALSRSQVKDERILAADALAKLGDPLAIDRLGVLLQLDREPSVRQAAARAFVGTRNPQYEPWLRQAAAVDPDPQVRGTAERTADVLWGLGRSPRQAAGLSLLCPGCGYFHLHQPGRAAAYLGTTAALVATGLLLARDDGLSLSLGGDGEGPRMTPTRAPLALPALMAAQNLWFYGVFASYRDARLARGDSGYSYPVSREGLTDLVSAPVRPSVLRRPWFWAGLPVALGAAIGFSALVSPHDVGKEVRSLGDGRGVWFLGRHYPTGPGVALGETYYAGLFLPVGVGEESLFRGTLQPALCDSLGLWPGWLLTSAIFGGVHLFNFVGQPGGLGTAAKTLPFLTAVGSYLGLTAIKTGYTLETSVALHVWYDFLIGTVAFVADPDHQPFALRFGLPF
jgi:membrane protease YdiL (CAAX protease family)